MLKYAFMTLACPNWDLPTIAARAKEYGYDGVELRCMGDKHIDAAMTKDERERCKKLFADAGVAICGVAGYSRFNTEDVEELRNNQRMLMQNIDLARDLGAPTVRSFIGDRPKDMTPERAIEIAAEWLLPCCAYGAMQGIQVVLETHDDYCLPAVLKQVFDKMGQTPAKVLWDVQNAYTVGELGDGLCSQFGADMIAHVHIRDCHSKPDGQHELCMTGEGDLPLKKVKTLLEGIGYTGYVSFEWEKMWHPELEEPEEALPQFIAYMKSL
nr:sugar phosphate isomerase/epimerase [bacterium]